jgi:5-methyltetrahydrofolate--homocysteine methyltransferase
LIREIHLNYLEAGADIITTNTLNANFLAQDAWNTAQYAQNICKKSAEIALDLCSSFNKQSSKKPRYVAGSIGPTAFSVSDKYPQLKRLDFESLKEAFKQQSLDLIEAGVDLLLFETFFDPDNAIAALTAVQELMNENKKRIPLIISSSVSANGEHIFSDDFISKLIGPFSNLNLIAIGFNCSFGLGQILPYLFDLHDKTSFKLYLSPSAGMPDQDFIFPDSANVMTSLLEEVLVLPKVRFIGGCCGTRPDFIRQFQSISIILLKRTMSDEAATSCISPGTNCSPSVVNNCYCF